MHRAGFRFRLHRRDLPGTPDIVLPKHRIAIFVHGCFWHAHANCGYAKMPATRTKFWSDKLQRNVERDRRAVGDLLAIGWRVLCVWECAVRAARAAGSLEEKMIGWINSGETFGEISGLPVHAPLRGDARGDESKP